MRKARSLEAIRNEVPPPERRPQNAHHRTAAGAARSEDAFADSEANWMLPTHPSFAADPEAVRRAIVDVKARWDLC